MHTVLGFESWARFPGVLMVRPDSEHVLRLIRTIRLGM